MSYFAGSSVQFVHLHDILFTRPNTPGELLNFRTGYISDPPNALTISFNPTLPKYRSFSKNVLNKVM